MRIEYARYPVPRINRLVVSSKYISTRNVPISLRRPMGDLILGLYTGAAEEDEGKEEKIGLY